MKHQERDRTPFELHIIDSTKLRSSFIFTKDQEKINYPVKAVQMKLVHIKPWHSPKATRVMFCGLSESPSKCLEGCLNNMVRISSSKLCPTKSGKFCHKLKTGAM